MPTGDHTLANSLAQLASLMESAGAHCWEQPYLQHTLPSALLLQMMGPGLQQITQRDDPHELTWVLGKSRLGHTVDHDTQRFIRVGHHRIGLHHLDEPAAIALGPMVLNQIE